MEKTNIKDRKKYPGVHFDKRSGNWTAKFSHLGQLTQVGTFKDPLEASLAYQEATKFRRPKPVEDLDGEVWERIYGYENRTYLISNLGRVKNENFNGEGYEKLMALALQNSGYSQVILSKGSKVKSYLIHRAVWETFNGPLKKGDEINHIDFDKSNNCLSNLSVVTHLENVAHYHDSIDKGVGYYYKHHGPRWILFIVVNGTKRPMGTFDSLEEAQAYHREMMGCDLVAK